MQTLLGNYNDITSVGRNRTAGDGGAVVGGMSVPSAMPDI
jgi:hypothetical protein